MGISCTDAGEIFLLRLSEQNTGWINIRRVSRLERMENGTVLALITLNKKYMEEKIMAIDPVCGMKVEEKKAEHQTQFAGKTYFFCSEDCRKEFDADPDEYANTLAA